MEQKDVLVKVEGLSKKFCKDLKTSLWYGVRDLISNVKGNRQEIGLREKEFWAVKDISFELKRGECLGVIGHNGAGKSTLLKILNGLVKPDTGKVTIKGRVGALIELGAGFNPILTGRENIYNNGAILGFTRKEINEKLEEIIDFAEIREFIDMPVQHYSSGMRVRLGFAVAAQMELDVLIIDEVLAVGDLGFALKCLKTLDEILPNTAIIFVSHAMPNISRICTSIILLKRGQPLFQGSDVGKAIDLYYLSFSNNESNTVFNDGTISLRKVEILEQRKDDHLMPVIFWNNSLRIFFSFHIKNPQKDLIFRIIIYDKEQRQIAMLEENEEKIFNSSTEEDVLNFILTHNSLQLSKGIYSLGLLVAKGKTRTPLLRMNDIIKFQIKHKDEIWPSFLLASDYELLKSNSYFSNDL